MKKKMSTEQNVGFLGKNNILHQKYNNLEVAAVKKT